MLAALVLVATPLAQASVMARTPEPHFSSVVITEGIRGGIVGAFIRRRVELGYDWEQGAYRVTVYDPLRQESEEGPYLTAEVTRAWFEALLKGVLDRGLAQLPPQPDPDGPDVYRIDTGLSVFHGDLAWENEACDGCAAKRVDVDPTETERRQFADVVAFVFEATFALPLEPGCALDSGFAVRLRGRGEARAFLKALEHLLGERYGSAVDRRRVDILRGPGQYEVRFAWRGSQERMRPDLVTWQIPRCSVILARGTFDVLDVQGVPTEAENDGAPARRRAFLEDHPKLPARFRRLIAAGWIAPGMTSEMAVAAWGTPRSPSPLTYERHGELIELHFDDAGRLCWAPSVGRRHLR